MARVCRKSSVSDNDGIASEVFRFNFRDSYVPLSSLLIYSITLLCEKLTSQLSATVVASTPNDMEMMSRIHRIPENKMVVIPNPVDGGLGLSSLTKDQARVQLNLPLAIPIAVFVGDLTSPHNLEAISQIAFMLIKNRDLGASGLLVVAIGKFERVLPEWKIPQFVFTGPVKDL